MLKDRPMYSLGVLGLEAVRLVKESGKPAAQISRDLGVSVKSLKDWVKQQEIDSGQREGLTASEREELRKLRAENRILRMERKILKKPQPSLLGRRTELDNHIFVHRGREGELPYCHHVSRPGSLHQRIL